MQQFGVIGLSVMGKNLALNVRNHGFSVSGYSIDKPEIDALAKYEDDKLKPCYTLEDFVNSLEKPRKILIQIMAGAPVDETYKNCFHFWIRATSLLMVVTQIITTLTAVTTKWKSMASTSSVWVFPVVKKVP